MSNIPVPELDKALADQISLQCATQLRISRDFKRPRLEQIRISEDLYFGLVKKQLKNPFNLSFPFMPGFIDHFIARIDNAPKITFNHQDEADFKLAQKVTASFEQESSSTLPNAKWEQKDRFCKKLALFSGVGIYKYFADSVEDFEGQVRYKSHFGAVDHYDFHAEPGGGGILEEHYFCGEEAVFKTKEELFAGAKEGLYDEEQVSSIITKQAEIQTKANQNFEDDRLKRQEALGMDVESHSFTGNTVIRFVEWYTTFKGVRWYCLFEHQTGTWIRVKPLRELFKNDMYPYVTWHTNEEATVFWSKAPADDARPIAEYINRALNQELYNREKINRGQRAYDPDMFTDVEALADWRPDGLVPVDTKNGERNINSGLFEFRVAGLGGTIDLVQFLDSFVGQKTGSTPGSQGASERDKKVGIFFGELEQIEDFIGTKNKSYTEAWGEIGLRYVHGLDEHLTDEGMAVKLMGANGIEWSSLTRFDNMARKRDFGIDVKGGQEEITKKEVDSQRKLGAIAATTTVNPQWRDRMVLKLSDFTDDQIKEAFTLMPVVSQELMSEAKQAIDEIKLGKEPELNRGADVAYMQRIIDEATELTLKDSTKEKVIAAKLFDFAVEHTDIVRENQNRLAEKLIAERNMAAFTAPPETTGAGTRAELPVITGGTPTGSVPGGAIRERVPSVV